MSLKLEVGEFYLNANGEIVNIIDKVSRHTDSNGNWYNAYGKSYKTMELCSGDDLIAHIPKELHYEIIKTIKSYYTYWNVKTAIDKQYNERKVEQ